MSKSALTAKTDDRKGVPAVVNEYLSPEEMRRVVTDALGDFARLDMDLLHVSVHEQTVAHRLAIYIEARLKTWHVDCEYNRDRHFPKMRPSDRKKIIPDIVVHRRNSPRNLLIVEIKKSSHSKRDKAEARRRVKDLTGQWTTMPRYCHGVVLTFPVKRGDSKEVACEWYHRDGCNSMIGGDPQIGTVSVPLPQKLSSPSQPPTTNLRTHHDV